MAVPFSALVIVWAAVERFRGNLTWALNATVFIVSAIALLMYFQHRPYWVSLRGTSLVLSRSMSGLGVMALVLIDYALLAQDSTALILLGGMWLLFLVAGLYFLRVEGKS